MSSICFYIVILVSLLRCLCLCSLELGAPTKRCTTPTKPVCVFRYFLSNVLLILLDGGIDAGVDELHCHFRGLLNGRRGARQRQASLHLPLLASPDVCDDLGRAKNPVLVLLREGALVEEVGACMHLHGCEGEPSLSQEDGEPFAAALRGRCEGQTFRNF